MKSIIIQIILANHANILACIVQIYIHVQNVNLHLTLMTALLIIELEHLLAYAKINFLIINQNVWVHNYFNF